MEANQLNKNQLLNIVYRWYNDNRQPEVFKTETHIDLSRIIILDEDFINESHIEEGFDFNDKAILECVLFWYKNHYKLDETGLEEDGIIENKDGVELDAYCQQLIDKLFN